MNDKLIQIEPPIAPGDFYVPEHECVSCGVPASVAPDLIRHHSDTDTHFGSCYFYKQPQTSGELDRAVAAVQSSCVCAVRYRGTDPAILSRISRESADHPAPLLSRTLRPHPKRQITFSTPDEGLWSALIRRLWRRDG